MKEEQKEERRRERCGETIKSNDLLRFAFSTLFFLARGSDMTWLTE